MTELIDPLQNHAFVGVWVTESDDSDVSFEISALDGVFQVVGTCISDGEVFEIKNISSGIDWLSFDAMMPSTGFRSKNVFRLRDDDKAELELTVYEVWKKIGPS